MDCSRWRDALSAMADGEDAGIDERLVAAHVGRCAPCQSYQRLIEKSAIPAASSPPAPMPDLSKTISKLNAAADRAAHWSILRIVLAIVAAQVILFALPALILGEEHGVETHAARHLGAFGVAYGVALFVVVVRPARARSILPVALGAGRGSAARRDRRSGDWPHSTGRRGPAPASGHQRLPHLVPRCAVDVERRCSHHTDRTAPAQVGRTATARPADPVSGRSLAEGLCAIGSSSNRPHRDR